MRVVPLWVTLVVLTAGCLQAGDARDELRTIFGADALSDASPPSFTVPVLEGRFADGPWSGTAATEAMARVTLTKADPGPQGGGGTTQALEPPAANASLEVRFAAHDRLAGFQARWAILHGPNDDIALSSPRPATEAETFPIQRVGPAYVVAELLKDDVTVARVTQPFVASVGVHWTVESAVRPFKPAGAPPPGNYEAMADKFLVDVHVAGASLDLRTKFRGAYGPGQGTDVDLELDRPDGTPHECSGDGGGAGAVPNDPAQSTETITARGLDAGVWTIRVGSMRIHPACTPDAYYHNAGMVPYALEAVLHFLPPTSA
jgi:hypothetical protein